MRAAIFYYNLNLHSDEAHFLFGVYLIETFLNLHFSYEAILHPGIDIWDVVCSIHFIHPYNLKSNYSGHNFNNYVGLIEIVGPNIFTGLNEEKVQITEKGHAVGIRSRLSWIIQMT